MKRDPCRLLCSMTLVAANAASSWAQSIPLVPDAAQVFAAALGELAQQRPPRDDRGRQRQPPRDLPPPPAPPVPPAPPIPPAPPVPPAPPPPRREEPRHEHPSHDYPRRDYPRPDYPPPWYPQPPRDYPDPPRDDRRDYPPRDDRRDYPYPEPPRGPYYGSPIERLREISRGIEEAAARWRSAPSGSFEERFAQRRMEDLMDEARTLISSRRLADASVSELEVYGREAAAGWRRASSGSTLERFYDLAAQGAWDAAILALERSVLDVGDDFRQLEQSGLRYEEGWRRAPSGSREERFYAQAGQVAFDGALRALNSWLAYRRPSGYELERLGSEFDQRYRRAPSGSKSERYYRQAAEAVLSYLGRRW